MKKIRLVATLGVTLFSSGLMLSACGDDSATTDDAGGAGGNGGTGNVAEGICLAHNCENDSHCAACVNGRTVCDTATKICVACSVDEDCDAGFYCPNGQCVPDGVVCPNDAGTFCQNSGDCQACDFNHQVCDPASGACVACSDTDTSECQSTEICDEGVCTPACSNECQSDNDCAQCPGAKACNAHQCSECSPTYACPAGEICRPNGTCQTECGVSNTGSCATDDDCSGCVNEGVNATTCHLPLNGPPGTCGPSAAGCSDLGEGTVVLPQPWNQYTNLCSSDVDCTGVGAVYNIGKALRDLTGIDEIGDANITYPMNACAAVELADVSCGICVPCQEDSDCGDIDIDQLAAEAFGPIGSLAAALLLDQVFGAASHTVHMYCETVAAGYGICAPCPGLLNDCGVGGGSGGGSGNCDHSPQTAGGPLDPSCGACEATVCAIDDYCCNVDWDSICVDEAAANCN